MFNILFALTLVFVVLAFMVPTGKPSEEWARQVAIGLGLDPEGVYWCFCCKSWAHELMPCDCAYELCEGECVGYSD